MLSETGPAVHVIGQQISGRHIVTSGYIKMFVCTGNSQEGSSTTLTVVHWHAVSTLASEMSNSLDGISPENEKSHAHAHARLKRSQLVTKYADQRCVGHPMSFLSATLNTNSTKARI